MLLKILLLLSFFTTDVRICASFLYCIPSCYCTLVGIIKGSLFIHHCFSHQMQLEGFITGPLFVKDYLLNSQYLLALVALLWVVAGAVVNKKELALSKDYRRLYSLSQPSRTFSFLFLSCSTLLTPHRQHGYHQEENVGHEEREGRSARPSRTVGTES